METKANYVAVGAFVLACVIGAVISALWLVGAQYRQDIVYQSRFEGSVTGIGKGTIVRYNGIEAGRVDDLVPDPVDPLQHVLVTLLIDGKYNIREGSRASIASAGLTGGAYVEIDGGGANSPLLTVRPGYKYPLIPFKPSTMQQLEKSLPEAITTIKDVAGEMKLILGPENQKHIASLLVNVDTVTGTLASHSEDIGATLANAKQLTASLTVTSNRLQKTLDRADITFDNADSTLKDYGKLARDADAFVTSDGMSQISDLVGELRRLTSNLNKFSEQLNREPTALLFGDRRKGYEPKDGSK